MFVCVKTVFQEKNSNKKKEKLYRSIHFNYTRRGGINAAARDHRLGELKKVNCYSFTSNDTVVFQHIQFKKNLGVCTQALTHAYTHTNKINRKKE